MRSEDGRERRRTSNRPVLNPVKLHLAGTGENLTFFIGGQPGSGGLGTKAGIRQGRPRRGGIAGTLEWKRRQVSVCPQKQSQIYLQSVEQKISPNIGPLYKVLCIEEIKEALRRCPGGKQTPHPAEVEVEVEEPHDVEEVRRDLRLLAQLDGENPRRNFRAFEELAW